MWKQILGDMDDFDFQKVMEIANLFWDDREKITETVNMVWDNRERLVQTVDYISKYQDHITDVVTYIGENKDRLGELIDRLPELLDKTGVGIETAGMSAERASALLTGDSKDDDVISAYEMTGMAAIALQRCNVQLEHVAMLIQELGDKIDGIRIPSVKPQYTDVMGFKVISGIDLEEGALADDVAVRFRSSADRISEISDDFTEVSAQFRKLGTMLVHTGDNLNSVGAQLQHSGQSLRAMTAEKGGRRTVTIELEPAEQPIRSASSVEKEIAKLQAEAEKVRAARAKETAPPVAASKTKSSSTKRGSSSKKTTK
jgi:hypothetical protein